MTAEKYAEAVGIEIGVVKGWIQRGYIPTKKIGKRRLVNIALITKDHLE